MPENLIRDEIDKSGLRRALEDVDTSKLLKVVEKHKADDTLVDQSFYRFLESLVRPATLPATWQKLADLGWADDEVSSLIATDLLKVVPTTLSTAIGSGALSLDEYNEFSSYPNQEVDIIYYGKNARAILAWLRKQIMLPKIAEEAFAE